MHRLITALTSWEWLILILLLPAAAFPEEGRALVLLAVPLLWIVRKASTGHLFPATPHNLALLLLTAAVLLSFLAIVDLNSSLSKITGYFFGIALFFAAVEHGRMRRNGAWTIALFIILAGTGMAVVALFFARWQAPFRILEQLGGLLPELYAAVPGTIDGTINLNEIAGVMVWILPLVLSSLLGFRHTPWRNKGFFSWLIVPILAACLAICLLVLIASNSRGALISFVVALLVMLSIRFRKIRWFVLLMAIAGITLMVVGSDLLIDRSAEAAETLKMDARLELWSAGIAAIKEFPITGLGLNGFRQLVHILYPLMYSSPDKDIGHSHNQLLQVGLDIGIPGLIAYLALWTIAAGLLWQGLRDQGLSDSGWRVLQIGLVGSLSAGWVFGIADTIALGARPGFIWWLLLAVAVSATADALTADTTTEPVQPQAEQPAV